MAQTSPLTPDLPITCPPSATHGLVALGGFLGLALGTVLLRVYQPVGNIACAATVIMAATALGIFLPDLLWRKIHRRNIGPAGAGNMRRSLVKLAGLLGAMSMIALLYWLFPEYHGSFYSNYWVMLMIILPAWLGSALPYIYWVDRRLAQPHDSLWQTGRFFLLQWDGLKFPVVGQYLLGWLVKGYFLPLMFIYLCDDLDGMLHYDFHKVRNFSSAYDFLYDAFYFVDVGMISMTYIMTLKLTDTHIRSSEPSGFGWMVALFCYQPFWSQMNRQYIDYNPGRDWGSWFADTPWAYTLWGSIILALLVIYAWTTVSFGGRFSNLTHRGIITNGPYRYSKHPAYISKNISWWLITMPFMINSTVDVAVRCSLLLLMLNTIYYLRAKTEERHLSLDPVYRQYALWIERRGVLRFLNRIPVIGAIALWRPAFGQDTLSWVHKNQPR